MYISLRLPSYSSFYFNVRTSSCFLRTQIFLVVLCVPLCSGQLAIVCPPSSSAFTDLGSSTALVSWASPTTTGASTSTISLSSPANLPVGVTVITGTAYDSQGNSVSCQFNITVSATSYAIPACGIRSLVTLAPLPNTLSNLSILAVTQQFASDLENSLPVPSTNQIHIVGVYIGTQLQLVFDFLCPSATVQQGQAQPPSAATLYAALISESESSTSALFTNTVVARYIIPTSVTSCTTEENYASLDSSELYLELCAAVQSPSSSSFISSHPFAIGVAITGGAILCLLSFGICCRRTCDRNMESTVSPEQEMMFGGGSKVNHTWEES